MNVDGKAYREAEDIRDCVLRQTVSPVQWTDTIRHILSERGGELVELGVGKTLCAFTKKICPDASAAYVENIELLDEFCRSQAQ